MVDSLTGNSDKLEAVEESKAGYILHSQHLLYGLLVRHMKRQVMLLVDDLEQRAFMQKFSAKPKISVAGEDVQVLLLQTDH